MTTFINVTTKTMKIRVKFHSSISLISLMFCLGCFFLIVLFSIGPETWRIPHYRIISKTGMKLPESVVAIWGNQSSPTVYKINFKLTVNERGVARILESLRGIT